ncbi:hypothetical protein CGRA01v4_13398 [Colletotrichum graminicola]|nr:hypothetical protein CGRA01v4_13398 [Colletotrichum graminicola]
MRGPRRYVLLGAWRGCHLPVHLSRHQWRMLSVTPSLVLFDTA